VTNTLAYYNMATITVVKSFIIQAQCFQLSGVKVIKLFPSSLMTRPNKLEGLPLVTLSSWVLEFEGKARANPIGGPFRCFLLGCAPGATSKC
jgi:hypothetical protein